MRNCRLAERDTSLAAMNEGLQHSLRNTIIFCPFLQSVKYSQAPEEPEHRNEVDRQCEVGFDVIGIELRRVPC